MQTHLPKVLVSRWKMEIYNFTVCWLSWTDECSRMILSAVSET